MKLEQRILGHDTGRRTNECYNIAVGVTVLTCLSDSLKKMATVNLPISPLGAYLCFGFLRGGFSKGAYSRTFSTQIRESMCVSIFGNISAPISWYGKFLWKN